MNNDDVKKALGEFVDDFAVDLQGDIVVVKAKHFVAKEEWDKVNNALRGLGGKWTSMGKASHWRIPVDVCSNTPVEGNILDRLDKDIDLLQICLRDLAEVKKALKQ